MNDNESGPGVGNVIDFGNRKTVERPQPVSATYEFHLHPIGASEVGETEQATGFLKFGPAFIAVVDGPGDESQVTFAAATPMCKYIKRLSVNEEVQATLAL